MNLLLKPWGENSRIYSRRAACAGQQPPVWLLCVRLPDLLCVFACCSRVLRISPPTPRLESPIRRFFFFIFPGCYKMHHDTDICCRFLTVWKIAVLFSPSIKVLLAVIHKSGCWGGKKKTPTRTKQQKKEKSSELICHCRRDVMPWKIFTHFWGTACVCTCRWSDATNYSE